MLEVNNCWIFQNEVACEVFFTVLFQPAQGGYGHVFCWIGFRILIPSALLAFLKPACSFCGRSGCQIRWRAASCLQLPLTVFPLGQFGFVLSQGTPPELCRLWLVLEVLAAVLPVATAALQVQHSWTIHKARQSCGHGNHAKQMRIKLPVPVC